MHTRININTLITHVPNPFLAMFNNHQVLPGWDRNSVAWPPEGIGSSTGEMVDDTWWYYDIHMAKPVPHIISNEQTCDIGEN